MEKLDNESRNSADENGTILDEKIPMRRVVVNVIAIVVCVLLLPILLINCTLLLKSVFAPDKVPTIFGRAPLVVLTESMDPNIKSGDLIVCEVVDAEDIQVGDVISFFDPDSSGSAVVTHRVVGIEIDEKNGEISFRTKGDNNNLEDRTSVPAKNLVGIWKDDGAFNQFHGLGSVVLFMQSAWGFILCIGLPLGAIAVVYFINKKKKEQAQQQDMSALLAELNALRAEKNEQAASNEEVLDAHGDSNADDSNADDSNADE